MVIQTAKIMNVTKLVENGVELFPTRYIDKNSMLVELVTDGSLTTTIYRPNGNMFTEEWDLNVILKDRKFIIID